MASKTEILNMALGHLAISTTVGDIETEKSEAARVGRRFYDLALKEVTEACPWPFLSVITALALVASEPNTEWAFSYRYPVDCAGVVRILSGIRNDNRQTRAPYKMSHDSEGRLIFSDIENAEIEYTANAAMPQIYPSGFTMAFSFYLAGLIAPSLTGGDPAKLRESAFKAFEYTVAKAKAKGFNEQQDEEEVESEFVRGRE